MCTRSHCIFICIIGTKALRVMDMGLTLLFFEIHSLCAVPSPVCYRCEFSRLLSYLLVQVRIGKATRSEIQKQIRILYCTVNYHFRVWILIGVLHVTETYYCTGNTFFKSSILPSQFHFSSRKGYIHQ